MVNRFTREVPFEVVYGKTLGLAVDLAALNNLPGASVTVEHLAE
jgi:hypothetical protein